MQEQPIIVALGTARFPTVIDTSAQCHNIKLMIEVRQGNGMNRGSLIFSTFVLSALLFSSGEAAAKSCIHGWAIPGTYTIAGNFRGKVEAAGARLTRDCRVIIRVPGVFSGTKVRKSGKCLRFGFKIEGQRKAFTAKWCNKVGYIPWKGRNIRASVNLVKRQAGGAGEPRKKQNFNIKKK